MTTVLLVQGNALHLPLRDASVHCCVTSPPYWGLRSYGIGKDAGEIGLEETLEVYVDVLVQVFREVKRVLRPDATLWLNLGDVYASGNRNSYGPLTGKNVAVKIAPRPTQPAAVPEKSLLGLPWRVALALQADGWVLRSDCIWDKPSCLPESVRDRPTRSHEYVFLFSKQARYYYDAHAIREPATMIPQRRLTPQPRQEGRYANDGWKEPRILRDTPALDGNPEGRNARTVWRIPSEGFSGSHFATFPTGLVRRCLLAATSPQVCVDCAAPWRRNVERAFRPMTDRSPEKLARASGLKGIDISRNDDKQSRGYCNVLSMGFSPTCACATGSQPATILDPFCGSATTLLVARELGHHAVGVDLSMSYLRTIARERLGLADLARWEGRSVPRAPGLLDDLPLFQEVAP